MTLEITTPRTCRGCNQIKTLADFPLTRGKRFYRCRTCHQGQITEWHGSNRERVAAIKNKFREKNWEQEKRDARERNRIPVNREKKRKSLLAWRHANPELDRLYQAKRRKQLTASGFNTFTADDIKRLYVSQQASCAAPWCRTSLLAGYHVDHIMPLALGGSNEAQNIQLLCPTCNVRKNAKHPMVWAQMNGRLFA